MTACGERKHIACGDGGHFGKPIQEGVPGLQQDPKAKPPRPTGLIFRSDYHFQPWIQLTGAYAAAR